MLKLPQKKAVLIATAALIGWGVGLSASPVLAHSGQKPRDAPVVKEQKDWGIGGDSAKVSRTIDVSMGDDMRFQPGSLRVKQARLSGPSTEQAHLNSLV